MLGVKRLQVWAAVWVAVAIYWLARGFWILTVALLASAGLLIWQARRDGRAISRRSLP